VSNLRSLIYLVYGFCLRELYLLFIVRVWQMLQKLGNRIGEVALDPHISV